MMFYCDDTSTNCYPWVEECVIYAYSDATYELQPLPPKNWKWYDIFRTWPPSGLLSVRQLVRQLVRRIQTRRSPAQRAKHKRRRYVQKLRA